MEKRRCHRFSVPGTTACFKKKGVLHRKEEYPDNICPVLDMSRGGARFLTNDRIKLGLSVKVKLAIPDAKQAPEINAVVRWVSKNREESYRYQTGIAFNAYGDGKKENPTEILSFIKSLESKYLPVNQKE